MAAIANSVWSPITGCAADFQTRGDCLTECLGQPFRWEEPRRIIVEGDLFHKAVPTGRIVKVWAVMALARQHTFQISTKEHDRLRSLLTSGSFVARVWGEVDRRAPGVGAQAVSMWPSMPLPNVWIGAVVEGQKQADVRIPALLETPAAVRWISAEPLIGPIDLFGKLEPPGHRPRLTYWLDGRPGWGPEETSPAGLVTQQITVGPRLNWVVAGGGSGPDARPSHPDWFRQLRDQCQAAGVPFCFKQWGEWEPIGPLYGDSDEVDDAHLEAAAAEVHEGRHVIQLESSGYVADGYQPTDPRTWLMARASKKRAGRVLDGHTWDESPATAP